MENNEFIFNNKNLQNIKRKIEVKTGVQLNQNNENEAFKPVRILRKPASIIALMICFVMLASAAVAVIYQTQYIPGIGFVEGDYEIYYTPEILTFDNKATVETITRVKEGKSSELSIIITDMLHQNIKIITEKHGEFNLTPVIDYRYSSFGTLNKYSFDNEGGYSSYGFFIKNFPDINEFTLVNNGESVDVKLVPSNPEAVLIAEDSGISVRFYSMSKGSKVLAYEIYEDKSNFLNPMTGMIEGQTIDVVPYRNIELGPGLQAFRLYDENGNKIFLNGYDSRKGPDGLSEIMFLRVEQGKKISKIEVDYVGGSISTPFMVMTSIGDIPVPADGEEIFFDDGLLLYDSNGLISKLTYIKRERNNILIYTDTEYIGEDIENIDIYINWNGILGSKMGGWTGNTWFEINGDEEFIKLYIKAVYYKINGNWEINFN
jgi:hypothetical protein